MRKPITRYTVTFTSMLLLLSCSAAWSQRRGPRRPPRVPEGVAVYRDLAYVPDGHERQKLDIYLPEAGEELPLIIWVHGGAFRAGSKEGGVPLRYLAHGYAIASLNYRLSQHAIFPAQIEDIKAAVRWLRAHAKTYRLDPKRFGTWGSSAGGHLVAMLGVTGDIKEFEVGGHLDVSSRVQVVVNYFGPTDFLQMDAQRLPHGMIHDAPDSPESQLVGGPIQEHKDRVARANPVTYASADDPPMLIVHGDRDPLVPYQQSVLLKDALEKVGAPVSFYRVRGEGHGRFKDPKVAELTKAFLDKHLKPSVGANQTRPNIAVYMVDDLGWNHISAERGTLGTYDKVYHTPHIEKLAANGLSFTHAYMQPNCAPTRAALVSGQYPARVNNQVYVVQHLNRFGRGGIKKEVARFRGPEQSEDVAAAAVTVAEALKKNGYATAHIGKYHVGGHKGEDTFPENVGFDINIGGSSQGHQPVCFASQINGQWRFKKLGRGHFDRFAAPYSATYVKRRGLPRELVGTPKHVSDALGDALEETVQRLSSGTKPFYLQFHSYAVHGPVRARPDLKRVALNRLGKDAGKKAVEYVGFISSVDENMGRLLAILDDPNGDGDNSDSITTNTLVLFTSDNGGTHASNKPLKGVKGEFFEGGIRVPLIAHWPSVVPAGTVSDHRVHAVDYYPTYLELAGNRWQPSNIEHPLDGESFADILRKPGTDRVRRPIFYLFPGYMDKRAQPCLVAIDDIQGKRFKLHYIYETETWELYCLTDDGSETRDIIQSRPDIAAQLSRNLDVWLKQSHLTWQPKYPLDKESGQPVGPPVVFN